MGMVPQGPQKFALHGTTGTTLTKTMLTRHELALLYALARHHHEGDGVIVDAGPLLGASTFALARGLHDNPALTDVQRRARIYSFDLFETRGYEWFFDDSAPIAATGSLLPEYLRANRDFLDSIVVHQGDFRAWPWPHLPIDIFFLDLAKSWDLNDHAVRHYFPCLVPDRSILIQQDYIHFNEYWIHLTMELYEEFFECLGMMYGASAYYRCIKRFTADDILDIRSMPYGRKMKILARARAKADPQVREVMKTAAAKCALEHGMLEDADALLASVDLTVPWTHETLDVIGIAEDNANIVRRMLENARAHR